MSQKKPILTQATFIFNQDGNCMQGGDEQLEITILADDSGGLTRKQSFISINTEQWAVESPEEMFELMRKSLAVAFELNNQNIPDGPEVKA
jgi:hypothetical protein